MENSKYLPVGSNIGGHYEIIDVLGDDDFEILYLVRDNHRKGSFFVLKELFLETFSSRNGESVFTIPEAQGVFDKRKNEIIAEIDMPKKKIKRDDVKSYGYIKDNHTIYTIMEFTNNFNIKSYLHFHPRDEIILPPLDLNVTKKKKSFLFLKILIVTVIVSMGLAFYAYTMLQKDKSKESTPQVVVTQTPIHYPDLQSRDQSDKEETTIESKVVKTTVIPDGAEYIPASQITVKEIVDETPLTPVDAVIAEDKVYIDNEVEEIPEITDVKITDNSEPIKSLPESLVEEVTSPKEIEQIPKTLTESSSHISLGTKIEPLPKTDNLLGTPIGVESNNNDFSRDSIKKFLDGFIASSATGSVEEIASKYDYHVDRYFSLKNVTHRMIKKDKSRYNRKWTHREFSIKDFRILKEYKKDGTDYCDIKTTTKWRVSTNSGKRATGTSKGFMSIKKTASGFKVKSIYTLK